MPLTDQYETIDPALIIVKRKERQRREITTEDLEPSIRQNGVINPIVITPDMVLVAGERRLTACKNLRISVPIRYLDTLSPDEAEVIQLEENVKRKELPWKDNAATIARLHNLYRTADPAWTLAQTAKSLSCSVDKIELALNVHARIDPHSPEFTPEVANASTLTAARTKMRRRDKKEGERIMNEMIATLRDPSAGPTPVTTPEPSQEHIICADFLEWAPKFTGRPFNLIHCDFPYGGRVFDGRQMSDYSEVYEDDPKVYWDLLKCFCEYRDNLLCHHGFVMLWFSMIHYTGTMRFLRQNASDIAFDPRPLVWHKSDNAGVCPDPERKFRQIYETALLGRRHDTRLNSIVSNLYAAPTQRKLHPSAKPEPMLKHFFRAMVDNHTRLLDPTCGSGTALCAADAMGAEYVFGMDVDKEHVESALSKLRAQRTLAEANRGAFRAR